MTSSEEDEQRRSAEVGPRMTPAPASGGDDPALDPYEINFLPQFRSGRGPRAPFVNDSGVVIGDHQYESPESPLSQWSEDTDPAVMAGDQWVHPFKDVGFLTSENRDYFEKGIEPGEGRFAHPDKNAAYGAEINPDGGQPPEEGQ